MSQQITTARTGPGVRRSPVRRRVQLKSLGELEILVVLIVVFVALNPHTFPTVGNLRTILDQAALPLILGVGATFVILMGSIDLSIQGVMGAAAMAFVLLSENSRRTADIGPWAFVVALGVGVALGLVSGLLHTVLKVPSFIVTLGIWFVGLGIATVLFGSKSIPFLRDSTLTKWPSDLTLGLPNSFLLALLVTVIGIVMARYTRLGRFAYAIGNDETISRSNGVPVSRFKVYVFVLAGVCSAVAGVLASLQLGAGSATIGGGTLFLTIAAVVIGGTSLGGGKGGIPRTAVGVLLLTVLNNGLILSGASPSIQSAISGAILVGAIVIAAWPLRGRLRIVK